ncbi:restriction endonuclease subunit S [Patescibacteria group bacterium]
MTHSIIQKSKLEGARRLDAEYYCSPRLLDAIDFYQGKEVSSKIQYGTSKGLNEEKLGYPTLRLNEFEEYFSGSAEKYCDLLSEAEFEDLKLEEGDVLICRTNGNPKLVGKAALVVDGKNQVFASYLFKVKTDKTKINPETLTIFLNSRFGRSEIEKFLMPSIQSNFSPAQFREIKVPKFSPAGQEQIREAMQESYFLLETSKTFYQQAEVLLLEELGLKDFEIENELSNVVNFSDVKNTNRIDAEYFQMKYEKILEKIEGYKNGSDSVDNKFKQNKILTKKEKDFYNYVEIGDVNVSSGEINFNKIAKNDLPANAKIKLNQDDLLVSKVRPYRGAVGVVSFEGKDLICSGAFTVLQEKTDYKKEVLVVLLRTIFYKELMMRHNVGTSYPVIKDEDILNLKVPILPKETQQKIAGLVKESHEARKKSKELLEQAKQKVEDLIEKK